MTIEPNDKRSVARDDAITTIVDNKNSEMNREHVIADELFSLAHVEISRGNTFIAYNTVDYFLDKNEMFFFETMDEAHEFSCNNISDYDNYKVIGANSVDELLKQIPYGESLRIQLLTTKNLNPMNEKNYDYLINQLKYTGFGEELNQQLKEKMLKQEPDFTLTFQKDYGKDETVATLQFRKSDESDMYFFNRYNLMLKNQQYPEAIKQTFYLGKEDANITLKEAYNLMSGRAVYKEDLTNKEKQEYKAWLQIDFKVTDKNGNYKLHPYNENYGFDLEKALKGHTIKEMSDAEQQKRLIESLQRGNRQSVTMTVHGTDKKLYIEAAPRFKSLNIYDESGKRLKPEDLRQSANKAEKQSSGQSEKQTKRQSQKGGGDDEGDAERGQKKTKRRRQSIS